MDRFGVGLKLFFACSFQSRFLGSLELFLVVLRASCSWLDGEVSSYKYLGDSFLSFYAVDLKDGKEILI